MRSRRSAGGRCASSTLRSAPRCESGPTSLRSWTAFRRTPRSTSRSSSCAARGSSGRSRSRTRCLRRLSQGLPEVLGRLHEETPAAAALMHSYPDWVAETWWRELGPEDALALMRRQNEPPETAVRTPEGPKVVESIPPDWLESGYAWPQSRGSQLAGAAVGARGGERVLDLCAAPGGKATQLAAAGAEVVAVEKASGPRAGARGERAPARRRADGRERGRAGSSGRPARVRPRARRCALLGPRRPQLAPRPPLARRAAPRPPACARARGRRARAPRRDGHVLGLHGQPRRERGRRRRARPAGRGPRLGVAGVLPPARPEFLLTLPHVHGTSGFFVARMRA